MYQKIKSHFLRLGPKRFVAGTILLLIILDLINTLYLRIYWIKKDLSMALVYQMIRQNGHVIENFSRETILEMKGFLDNTFYFFLGLIIVNNLFFYYFYYRKKLWAQGFVLFYTLTAALFAFTFLLEWGVVGWAWLSYNIATIFLYTYLFLGVKTLKHETTDAIPGHGKKEQ